MFEKARHEPGHAGENFQKPSSARPTQLNAKIEQATAATDAQVAIVLAERMIKTLCAKPSNSVRPSLLNHGENPSGQIKQWAVTALPHGEPACPQKPAFFACNCRIGGGIERMHRLGGIKTWLLTSIALVLLALVVLWLGTGGSPFQSARDFEECVEHVEAEAPPKMERGGLLTDCNARFAGRRKPGGGYTYYDFMQDRKFDIAGPNPTAEERKQIDRAYMGFLDAQQREAVSAELANRQNEQLRASLESARQQVAPPMALKSTNSFSPPLPVKRPVDRSKPAQCEGGSLSCSWAKLSAVVKNAFASSPKTNP